MRWVHQWVRVRSRGQPVKRPTKKRRTRVRNPIAIAAHFRQAGAMKHKTAPRGGARRVDWEREEGEE